jgi:hypothetical protein
VRYVLEGSEQRSGNQVRVRSAVVMGADDVAMAPTPPGCPLAGAGRRGGAQGARAGVPVIFLTHLRPNCA